ncbi:MAG TPA: peptidylprolyl isomerase [Candidatus Krumholzibacteria bacterium]|nr:peptidylprolyl isomerase [Candidatus Krumholzibacteria bacterium]HPD70425.1 peptidylprolyl isomerase [Candidatus Krumholzibacteria bacterium]HRY39875.1 peptidylprolyl isomerase [Candidatus Krumholzibacteria bacterium]
MTPPRVPIRQLPVATGLVLAAAINLLASCGQGDEPGDPDAAAPGRRAAPAAPDTSEIAASHILVAWTGARDCPRGLQRTRDEAEQRARRIAVLLRSGRGEFGEMARQYSDDATADRNGGYLGVFRRGQMDPAFESLVGSLAIGQVGGPVATPYGWHVVRREQVRKVRIHHLLISYRKAAQAAPNVKRDRDEAARIAQALRAKIDQEGADPCVLAAQFSDDPQNRRVCGDLGWIEPGLLEPAAEEAVFALVPGDVSPVVESVYGFHIFWRD